MTNNIEMLEKQAERARIALQEAKRAAEQARREAERAEHLARVRAKNKAAYDAYALHADEVVEALDKLGYDVRYVEPENFDYQAFPRFRDLNDSDVFIQFIWRGGDSYGRGPKHPALRVGTWSKHKDFPLKKDGTFSYDKVAAAVVETIKTQQALRDRRAKEQERDRVNIALANDVRLRAGLSQYSSNVSTNRYKINTVDISVNLSQISADRAVEILTALKKMGVELR